MSLISKIDYVIGVDADTYFDPRASIELLREIDRKETILATTGLVRVMFPQDATVSQFFWQGFQHVQYISGQGLLRTQQHLTQQKLSCLPGCINIARINDKTCGEKLMGEYTKLPTSKDHIFNQIRGHLSQDRHSTTLMLKHFSDCHTTATWKAHAVTGVPTSWDVFLSQRKRWSLGSTSHSAWTIFMPNIPLWERFSSMLFVMTYLFSPYLFYSLVIWVLTILETPTDTGFWILTSLSQVPTLFKLGIPFWISMTKFQVLYYYLFYPVYYFGNPIMSIIILINSLYHMDDFGWGKTREVQADTPSSAKPLSISEPAPSDHRTFVQTVTEFRGTARNETDADSPQNNS